MQHCDHVLYFAYLYGDDGTTFWFDITIRKRTPMGGTLHFHQRGEWALFQVFTQSSNYLLIANSCCKPLDRRLTFVKCIRSHDSLAANVDRNQCQSRVCRWLCLKRCRAEPPKTNCHHCKPRNAGRVQTQNCVAIATTVEILISSLTIHIKLKHFGSSFMFCW